MKQVTRYHPVLVALHWLLAFLIIAMLTLGYFVTAATPNDDPEKLVALRGHMSVGMLILALTLVRLAVRVRTTHPPRATTGSAFLDSLAPTVHYGLYVLVVLMAGTGFATALLAGLPEIVFAESGEPLPPDLRIYPTRVAHGIIAVLLVTFVALHIAAALYHQFGRRDALLSRMLFGRRTPQS